MTSTSTSTSTYKVTGMTCGHCEASVRGALTQLPGVRDVSVDLDSGQVKILNP